MEYGTLTKSQLNCPGPPPTQHTKNSTTLHLPSPLSVTSKQENFLTWIFRPRLDYEATTILIISIYTIFFLNKQKQPVYSVTLQCMWERETSGVTSLLLVCQRTTESVRGTASDRIELTSIRKLNTNSEVKMWAYIIKKFHKLTTVNEVGNIHWKELTPSLSQPLLTSMPVW